MDTPVKVFPFLVKMPSGKVIEPTRGNREKTVIYCKVCNTPLHAYDMYGRCEEYSGYRPEATSSERYRLLCKNCYFRPYRKALKEATENHGILQVYDYSSNYSSDYDPGFCLNCGRRSKGKIEYGLRGDDFYYYTYRDKSLDNVSNDDDIRLCKKCIPAFRDIPKRSTCKECQGTFRSKNELFRHLYEQNHFV